LSVLLIGLFYTVSTWALVNGIGIDKVMPLLTSGDPTTLLFDQAAHYIGEGMLLPMQVLFVTSIFASLLAFHNAVARYFFAMGREGLLPQRLGVAHERFASPHRGSVTQSLVAAVMLGIFTLGGADPVLVMFTLNSAVATLGIIVLMAITALATLFFFKRNPELKPGLFTTLCSLVALAGLGSIAGLAVYHFDVFTGDSTGITPALPLLVLAAAVLGAVLANRKRTVAAPVADWAG
jgi:amino acid transporter